MQISGYCSDLSFNLQIRKIGQDCWKDLVTGCVYEEMMPDRVLPVGISLTVSMLNACKNGFCSIHMDFYNPWFGYMLHLC